MNPMGVYQILNIVNDKRYIGSSIDMRVRLRNHRWSLQRKSHTGVKLQNAWNKYGSECFCFDVIEFVEDKSKLAEREQYWIDLYQSASSGGYNIKPLAYSNSGFKLSQETKNKISAKRLGTKVPRHLVQKWAAARIGKKHKPETIAKMRISNSGRKLSNETKEKLSKAATGRKASEATKAAMSAAHSGLKQSEDHIAQRVKKQLGQKRSAESRQKMSEAQRLRFLNNPIKRGATGSFISTEPV